jgi:hypothetical protein
MCHDKEQNLTRYVTVAFILASGSRAAQTQEHEPWVPLRQRLRQSGTPHHHNMGHVPGETGLLVNILELPEY